MSTELPQAIIRWRTPEEGGRTRPFVGPRYAPTTVVDGGYGRHWSMVVEFIEAENGRPPTHGRVRFLFPEAPHESLRVGARFRLFEGPHVVADGRIVAAAHTTSEMDAARA